ncbi:GNAT family N-acetyltransferase [Embleya scabrispora]|uniref:GNAT family N-acetyltransferase n=1 Tax=Embleya scabrispora TaxID=159449 RepID=UPI00037EBD22|nr:GNAT family N-acetyltransferase [Embleya scabrispora]MYS87588.1 GNAT family N-acetyltransferase [Streptomyces sp. SID5474]
MSDQQLEVVVRRARPADLDGLIACSSALFAEDAGTRDPSVDVSWPREYGPAHFAAGMDDPSMLLLVADYAGRVVAFLAGSVAEGSAKRPARTATLVSLYVDPAHRHGGLGVRLVNEFSAWAKEVGAELAEVTAYCSNADAIRFYERNGFARQTVTLRLLP